jgi:hypothetical protein
MNDWLFSARMHLLSWLQWGWEGLVWQHAWFSRGMKSDVAGRNPALYAYGCAIDG